MDTSKMSYPFGRCAKCGKEFNSELRNEDDIIYCPWCGEHIDDCFAIGNAHLPHVSAQIKNDVIFCENCGTKIYENGSWIVRDGVKGHEEGGVCSGPCERELCGKCGDWDDEGLCPMCALPCGQCPKEECKKTESECDNPCGACTMKNDCLTDVTDKRDECNDYRKFKKSLPQYKDEIKRGWWKVSFDLKLEGEEVQFDDLSETSQEHIIECIKDGCLQGELIEEIDDDNQEETPEEDPAKE